MTELAKTLMTNLDNMTGEYSSQFNELLGQMSQHNIKLQELTKENTKVSKQLYEMTAENETLEMRANALKADRDLHVVLDERHKIEMLKVDTADAIRRAQRMGLSLGHAIQSWTNRVSVMQR